MSKNEKAVAITPDSGTTSTTSDTFVPTPLGKIKNVWSSSYLPQSDVFKNYAGKELTEEQVEALEALGKSGDDVPE